MYPLHAFPLFVLPSLRVFLLFMSFVFFSCLLSSFHVFCLLFMSFVFISCLSYSFHVFCLHFMSFFFISCLSSSFHIFRICFISFVFVSYLSYSFHIFRLRFISFVFVSYLSSSFHVFRLHFMSFLFTSHLSSSRLSTKKFIQINKLTRVCIILLWRGRGGMSTTKTQEKSFVIENLNKEQTFFFSFILVHHD
jgi:hypothetical protein